MAHRHNKEDKLFFISGQVRVLETGRPIPDVVVKAFDKDLIFDDLLGAVHTGPDGRFSLTYDQEDFKELFEASPDIYLKVTTRDRSKILFSSKDSVRPNASHKEYFDITIPLCLLKEKDMDDNKSIGQITLEIDKEQLKRITQEGRLEEFAEKAAAIFARDLKSELVAGSVSSVNTNLAYLVDDFGTGPRPPHWHNIGKIDDLLSRVSAIEKVIRLNTGILESKNIKR